jgi:hypothetical protein
MKGGTFSPALMPFRISRIVLRLTGSVFGAGFGASGGRSEKAPPRERGRVRGRPSSRPAIGMSVRCFMCDNRDHGQRRTGSKQLLQTLQTYYWLS